MKTLIPQLTILPPAQLALWYALTAIPSDFVLYGGTALALHLGHRDSVDFDLFSDVGFDPDLLSTLPLLEGAPILEKASNTLTVRVDRQGPVKLSFFGVPKLKRLRRPHAEPYAATGSDWFVMTGWAVAAAAAYLLWDIGMRFGNVVIISTMSMLIPLASTVITAVASGQGITVPLAAAAALVVCGSVVCRRGVV